MIVRNPLPRKWRNLLAALSELWEDLPLRIAHRICRVNRRMIQIEAKRRPS